MNSGQTPALPWAVFIPAMLIVATLITQSLMTRGDLLTQRRALTAQYNKQQPVIDQSVQLRQQLESISGAVATLAEQGNPNAIVIRDQLKSQGITINPPKPAN